MLLFLHSKCIEILVSITTTTTTTTGNRTRRSEGDDSHAIRS